MKLVLLIMGFAVVFASADSIVVGQAQAPSTDPFCH